MSLNPLDATSCFSPKYQPPKRKEIDSHEQSLQKQLCQEAEESLADSVEKYQKASLALSSKAEDYNLLNNIEILWRKNVAEASSLSKKELKTCAAADESELACKIDQLYKKILTIHNLQMSYEASLPQEIERAISDFNPDRLRFLMQKVSSQDLRSHLYVFSARFRNTKALQIIAASGDLSGESKTEVAMEAAKKGWRETMSFLLQHPELFGEVEKNQAVILAAQHGQNDIIATFLDSHGLSDQLKGEAIEQAALHGHAETVRLILDRSGFMAYHMVSRALLYAVRSGVFATIPILLDTGVFEARDRETAVHEAASLGYYDAVVELLRTGLISRRARDFAILAASGSQRAQIVERLQQSHLRGPMPFHLFSGEVSLSFEEVAKNPERFLDLILRNGLPDRIQLLNAVGQPSPAADMGGVKKGFITRLFEALGPKLSLSSDLLPMFDTHSTDHVELYKKIAKVLSKIARANQESSDPCLIGSIFNPRFFEIVKLLMICKDQKVIYQDLAKILLEVSPDLKPLSSVILDPQKDHLAAFGSIYAIEDLSLVQEAAEKILESYLVPARAFVAEFNPALHEIFLANSWERASLILQGEKVSVAGLLKAIPEYSSSQSLHLAISWIREKITTSDSWWREQFLLWATEKKVISPGLKIVFQTTSGQAFSSHTCTNVVELPEFLPDQKELFLQALESQFGDLRYNKV